MTNYLVTLPERLVRSALGLSAGLVREVGDLVLPESVRQGQLYRNLVDTTLRFFIEQVGGAEGAYPAESALPGDFLARRAAGNAVEMLGVVAFRASPVWVLAAMADLCGLGRHLIPQLADELKQQGLLDKDATFESVDQVLDGLEKTSARVASAINTLPLDVASLRAEWNAIREEARKLQPSSLPSPEMVTGLWDRLRDEAAAQNRSVFETSSALALSAVRSLPEGLRWLSASAVASAGRTGRVFGGGAARALPPDVGRSATDRVRRVRQPSARTLREGGRRAVLAGAAHAHRTNPCPASEALVGRGFSPAC